MMGFLSHAKSNAQEIVQQALDDIKALEDIARITRLGAFSLEAFWFSNILVAMLEGL